MTVAALFVETGGVYFGLPDVDPWDEARDARLYAGPHPVVAHPPCERWGRYWSGGPSAKVRRELGDDGGCFEAALAAVRRWGGVLEHPADSHAFAKFGLQIPSRKANQWWRAGEDRFSHVAYVEQGHYGHRARKGTWLYAVTSPRFMLSELIWGPAPQQLIREAPGRRPTRTGICQNLSAKQRRATPPAFRDLLLSIARSARPQEQAA